MEGWYNQGGRHLWFVVVVVVAVVAVVDVVVAVVDVVVVDDGDG